MLKKIFFPIVLSAVAVSCTSDYERINIDPNRPTSLPLDYLLSECEILVPASPDAGSKTQRVNFANAGCLMQHMSSTDAGFYAGSFYSSASNTYTFFFDYTYPNTVKNIVNLIALSSEDPNQVNINSMARILKVMEFVRITDLYGDVPYFEAGRGFLDNNFTPRYDEQQDIYMDMLNELQEAGDAFNSGAYIPPTADFIYDGDLEKWKRAANSIMLRLALRLQNVDPASAQSWAQTAISRGLITSEAENITFHFDGQSGSQINTNPNSYTLSPIGANVANLNGLLWGKTFIDMMHNRQDPRLSVVAALKDGNNDPDVQVGLPNGVTANELATLPVTNLDLYSRPAPNMITGSAPWIYMTYAESQLLLAEAIERGYTSGSADAAFASGQASAITLVGVYGTTPTAGEVADYATANPYPATGLEAKLNAIHTEIYLIHAVTFNHIEAWANWRRTGYPVLVPVNPVGNETNGTIPRRLKYSPTEYGVNGENLGEAITRQGPDLFTTRVWWDNN
ncbi:hypothetical protein AM493_05885 [Flavobacterium akiainvivens]|uniref:SusD/RagB family nutrient-binding outer membrane lipoprotein n=1 Tax=Flavobacterium akiainvivens TaxID=1202724 RepID=A0A0M8MH16_9FLAO|nr:SusD/RagB family nutrient-binding outer membrane lipoprotein [Flavobacterium akiainvivens]KOS05617.1 hypothetical protein AM493_05885 [Flavobacterium akiainvivens]SFQ35442.1 Starch-binding associating with outer membrane [Flavobacterium akiainvivens]